MRCRAAETLLFALLLGLVGTRVAAAAGAFYRLDEQGHRHAAVPTLAEDCADPYFGLLIGVIDGDLFGALDTAYLDSVFAAHGGSKIPYQTIERMERLPASGGLDSKVFIRLEDVMEVPIPYAILGYNPGTLRSTQRLHMFHWRLGDHHVAYEEDHEAHDFLARDVELFVLELGYMEMDIDGWLDRIMGGKLDDVRLSGFAVFRDGERRIGLGFGYSTTGRRRTGAFDLAANESLFPAPAAYLALGRSLRELGEARLAQWLESRGEYDAIGSP